MMSSFSQLTQPSAFGQSSQPAQMTPAFGQTTYVPSNFQATVLWLKHGNNGVWADECLWKTSVWTNDNNNDQQNTYNAIGYSNQLSMEGAGALCSTAHQQSRHFLNVCLQQPWRSAWTMPQAQKDVSIMKLQRFLSATEKINLRFGAKRHQLVERHGVRESLLRYIHAAK